MNLNELNSLNVKVSSGKTIINNLTVNGDTNIHNSSGRISLNNFKSSNLNIKNNSGKVDITDTTIENKTNFDRVYSGNININGLNTDTLYAKNIER